MQRFLIHWFVVSLALWAAEKLVPGVEVRSLPVLAVSGLVLGLVNAVVRPMLTLLTLPLTILTLGIFYLFVNAAAFGLAAFLVPGFTVRSVASAILGALTVSIVSWFIELFTRDKDD